MNEIFSHCFLDVFTYSHFFLNILFQKSKGQVKGDVPNMKT